MDEIYEKKTLIDNGVDIDKNYKSINILIDREVKNAKKIRETLKKNIVTKLAINEDDFNADLENFLNSTEITEDSLVEYELLIQQINFLKDKYQTDKNKIRLIDHSIDGKIKLKKIS